MSLPPEHLLRPLRLLAGDRGELQQERQENQALMVPRKMKVSMGCRRGRLRKQRDRQLASEPVHVLERQVGLGTEPRMMQSRWQLRPLRQM